MKSTVSKRKSFDKIFAELKEEARQRLEAIQLRSMIVKQPKVTLLW